MVNKTKKHRPKKKDDTKKTEQSPEKRVTLCILKKDEAGKLFAFPLAKKARENKGVLLSPADQKRYQAYDLVKAIVLKNKDSVTILSRLDQIDMHKKLYLIALYSEDIPFEFPVKFPHSASSFPKVKADKIRKDLSTTPFVTIDGEDAKDFDDAVFAEPDTDPDNKGGWHLMVAIADVAFYVEPHSELDLEAFKRGNSVYFPGHVVPMLPEILSNNLCSLRADEDKAALVADMRIDKTGHLLDYKFERALIRSHARLTYTNVQKAFTAQSLSGITTTNPDLLKSINHLYAAFDSLKMFHMERVCLDLDLIEHEISLHLDGSLGEISVKPRLDSHHLIEEFMVLANVAAAKALNKKKYPCIFRCHDQPPTEKFLAFKDFINALNSDLKIKVDKPGSPEIFMQAINKFKNTPMQDAINEMSLRSQAQASYQPENIGHFGLHLKDYAHFTSPIRRYSDLIVHRLLIDAHKLGPGGFRYDPIEDLEPICTHINQTERRAAQAERDTADRLKTVYLSDQVGQKVSGIISGVTSFALFVSLEPIKADGILPLMNMKDDYYVFEESSKRIIGQRTKAVFQLGQRITPTLIEVDPFKGSAVLELGEDTGRGQFRNRDDRRRRDAQEKRPPRGRPGVRPGKRPAEKSARRSEEKPEGRPGKKREHPQRIRSSNETQPEGRSRRHQTAHPKIEGDQPKRAHHNPEGAVKTDQAKKHPKRRIRNRPKRNKPA